MKNKTNAITELMKEHQVSYIEALEMITGKTISRFEHGKYTK